MLLQNGTLNAQYPRRMLGGIMSGDVQMSRRGDRINRLSAMNTRAGEPSGALAPITWNLPRKAGLMASYVGNAASAVGAATGAQGYGSTATAATAATGDATGIALAAGEAAASATAVGSATGTGVAAATATATAKAVGAATAGGVASGTASGAATSAGSVVPGAIGWGTAGPETTGLTEDGIAAAVWNHSATGPDGSKASDIAKTLKAAKLAAALSA